MGRRGRPNLQARRTAQVLCDRFDQYGLLLSEAVRLRLEICVTNETQSDAVVEEPADVAEQALHRRF